MRTAIAAIAVFLFVVVSGARMTEGKAQSAPPTPAAPGAQTPASPEAVKAGTTPVGLVDQYCIGCHSERGKAGGLTLAGVDLNDAHNAEIAEKVIRKLRGGLMPPAGNRRP